MKRKKITFENFGTINLENLEFLEDTFCIMIPVESVSDDLQKRIDEAIEKTKIEVLEERRKNRPDLYKDDWSEKGVDIFYKSFNISVVRNAMYCELDVGFVDKENDHLETNVFIPVDLPEYKQEIKKIIVHAVVDTFLKF